MTNNKKPIATSKLTSKFQATIPDKVREKLKLDTGDIVVFYEEEGRIYIR